MFMSLPSVNEIQTKANPIAVKDGTNMNIQFHPCLQPNNEKTNSAADGHVTRAHTTNYNNHWSVSRIILGASKPLRNRLQITQKNHFQ